MEFYLQQINYLTPQFDVHVNLRKRVLRDPLNIELRVSDFVNEADQLHFGLIDAFSHDLIACCSVQIFTDKAKIRQVAVEPLLKQRGLGRTLMVLVERELFKQNHTNVYLHARHNVVAFYEKLGYRLASDVFKEINMDHYKMQKQVKL